MDVVYREESGYLAVEMNGQWDLPEASRQIKAIRDRATSLGVTRVLIDCRDLATPKDTTTRFLTGEHIANFWRPPIKVAAIAGPDMVAGKFAETVALNRGAWFAVFMQEEIAMQWLMEGSGSR